LSDFLIDNDNDGYVDPAFINYELGYLVFPEARPFPDEVYTLGINVYLMDYEFSTQSVFYRLREQPVLIGSEKVFVDGEQMLRDYHYIIDYTSGTILFLSEETVNDFSEVEIQYVSVERQRDDIFYAIQPNMKIGSNLNLAPGYTAMEDEKILHLSARYEADAENASLLFVPQMAANRENAYAHDYLLIANYHRLTFNANYRGYSDEFESFGLSERRYGKLKQRGTVSLGFEPANYVRFNTSFKKESLVDTANTHSSTQYISGRIDYLNPNLPNGFLLVAKNILPDHDKIRLQLNTNYNLQVSQNNLRFSSVARQDFLTFETDRKKTIEYTLNANIAFRFPLRADFYLHGINLYENDVREKDENEMRLALNIDVIPGLYYTGNYRQKRQIYYLPESKDVSIMNYFYNNLNVAPGRWYAPLSIVNLSLGSGTNFDEYLDNLALNRELPSIITTPLEDSIETLTDLRTVYVKAYLTPFSNLNLQLKHAINRSGTARYDLPILRTSLTDEIRAEYEQTDVGYLTAVFNLTETNLYPVQTTQNLYLEWTKPWSALLRTRLSSNIRSDTYDYETAETDDTETSVRLETLLRFGGRSYVNISLTGRRQDRYFTGISRSIQPGCSINLNVLEFLFMQFDYEASIVIDGLTTHLLSAKITGSF